MTKRQALRKARELWGEHGAVTRHPKSAGESSHKGLPRVGRFRVGVVVMGLFFEVKGHGESWAAAVEDATAARG